jgi:hypothetical protein
MADPKSIKKILQSAHKAKLLIPADGAIHFAGTLNIARKILLCLSESGTKGLSTEQLQLRTGFNTNTLLIYLRELAALKLVGKQRDGCQVAIWFLL